MSMRRFINLVENAAVQTLTLFHGTSAENAFSILSGKAFHGFPDRGIETDAGVSFTTDFDVAERFAEGAYYGDAGTPVVIAVDKLRLEHDGHRVVQWVRPDGRGRNEREWRVLGTSIPTSAITAVYINGRHHSPAEAPEALRKTLLSDFLGSLTPDDTGREIVGGMVVRFEGFTDYCQQDALDRCALPPDDPRHLASFDAVYGEILTQWEREEGQAPSAHGFAGDDDYPILWASFEHVGKMIAEGQGKPFITVTTEWGTVRVWTNPTPMMANRLLMSFQHGVRGLVYPDMVLLWDAEQAIHSDIAHGFRPDAEWQGFAVVPQDDDLVVGEYDDDKPSWITKNGYAVHAFVDDEARIERLFSKA